MNENEMLEVEEKEDDYGYEYEAESEQEEDGMEFTDTGANEDDDADHPTDSEDDEHADDAVKEITEGKSKMQAEKRREREAKEKAIRKRIEQESYRKGIVDAVGGVNPYTNEEIKDEADVDEYLLMRKLEKQGKDPIEDYASAVKGEKRAKAQEAEAEKNRKAEVAEFAERFPDVDMTALLQDPRFGKFAGKRVQNETLANVYADYLEFTQGEAAEIERKAAVKAKAVEMKRRASPGSLQGNGTNTPRKSYADMSDAEFERELARAKMGALRKT
jgi:hypothetical protein